MFSANIISIHDNAANRVEVILFMFRILITIRITRALGPILVAVREELVIFVLVMAF